MCGLHGADAVHRSSRRARGREADLHFAPRKRDEAEASNEPSAILVKLPHGEWGLFVARGQSNAVGMRLTTRSTGELS